MQSLKLNELVHQLQQYLGGLMVIVYFDPFHSEYRKALNTIGHAMGNLRDTCRALNLQMTEISIQEAFGEFKAIRQISEEGPDGKHSNLVDKSSIPQIVNRVVKTLRDEASLRLYFHLPGRSVELYSDRQPFGRSVATVFPSAAFDIEESAKCLALERATASVFHSMRVMEFGLRTLIGESFGAPEFLEEVSTWGAFCNRIRREANEKDGKIAAAWTGKQDRLMKLAGLVAQVADTFRNPTMHCESFYTVEQATDVYQATGAFMRRLAEDFGVTDEEGPREPDDTQGA